MQSRTGKNAFSVYPYCGAMSSKVELKTEFFEKAYVKKPCVQMSLDTRFFFLALFQIF